MNNIPEIETESSFHSVVIVNVSKTNKVGNGPVNMHIDQTSTGFNRSLLVIWWSIGRLKKNLVDVKILGIIYPPFYLTL